MNLTQIFIGVAISALLASCRHEPDLTNVPEVRFGTEIQTILSSNCTMSGCHDGGRQFSLIGYDDVISNGSVKAGDAHNSKLYLSITGREGEIMPPQSSPSLTDKQLQQIYVWIERGAKNN